MSKFDRKQHGLSEVVVGRAVITAVWQTARQHGQWRAWLTPGATLLGIVGALCLIVVSLGLLSQQAKATYDLPPRDNPETEVQNSSTASGVGGRVHLRVHFSETWPWDSWHWQEDFWHTIEWQDADGNWYPVEGWQGTLDSISQEGTSWVATKELWVDDPQLGGGPFRWHVVEQENDRVWATSKPFYLPAEAGGLVQVDISLAP